MVDQLSRSDARADGDDTVSIDGSSNGTVPEKLDYAHHPSDHHDDTETQTLSASGHLVSGLDVKQVLPVRHLQQLNAYYSSIHVHCVVLSTNCTVEVC